MHSNDIAVDDFAGIDPQDTEAVWLAGPLSSVSLAYRRAATLLSIYRSRMDFLDHRKLESGIRSD
jgi:hypothetical protein